MTPDQERAVLELFNRLNAVISRARLLRTVYGREALQQLPKGKTLDALLDGRDVGAELDIAQAELNKVREQAEALYFELQQANTEIERLHALHGGYNGVHHADR